MVAQELDHPHLNNDAAVEKQARRLCELRPRACKQCGHVLAGTGYMGYTFRECPICSGDLEEVTG